MRKKRVVRALMITALVLGLFFEARMITVSGEGTSLGAEMGEPHSTEIEDESGRTESELEVIGGALEAHCRQILNTASKEFFQGYPVDDSFLCWVHRTYGETSVAEIAAQLSMRNQNLELWYQNTGNSMHALWAEYCLELGYATYGLKNVKWMETSRDDRTILDFTGDINLDEAWYTTTYMDSLENGIDGCISQEIQSELQSADLSVTNNEFTYSSGGEPLAGKAYTFRADPSRVTLLEKFGADLVSLGNNHAYDYGEQGLLDTMNTLTAAGIDYVGAGQDLDEAGKIQYYIMNGRKIAIVSATEIERFSNYTRAATENSPGVLKASNPEAFLRIIQEAGANSDYVIAYIHWGQEGVCTNIASQRDLAIRMEEAGADVIIGGHPHRMQGVEYIQDVPVVYSLGNFWFSTGTLYTTIAQIEIAESGALTLRMIPCIQKDLKTSMLMEEAEKASFYQYLADQSRQIGITEDGEIYSSDEIQRMLGLQIAYQSGSNYGSHSGAQDLEGRKIDIVGNLTD